jgi:pyridoxamine 5'-phosphate oxidase
MDLTDLRTDYEAERLDPDSLDPNPVAQFEAWFNEAVEANDPEPYAMVLSTVDAHGRPRGRNVLLRGADASGFSFYTNYGSAKAQAMDASGFAALTFRWFDLHRQVHVEGPVEKMSAAESDSYFAKRPRDSQLGAWASDQSTVLSDRSILADRLNEVTERFDGVEVPRPDFWGGFRVVPDRIEFWQGQPNRLHDRVQYNQAADGWTRQVLSP